LRAARERARTDVAKVALHSRTREGECMNPTGVANQKDKKTDPVQQIRDLVAVAASLVGVIYVSGVLVLGLRLWFEGLPPFAAVGSIPRETAISIGVVDVFAPAALLGAVFLVWITTFVKGPKPHYLRFNEAKGHRVRLAGAMFLGTLLIALPGCAALRLAYDGWRNPRAAAVGAAIVGGLTMVAYVHLRARIRGRKDRESPESETKRWKSTRSMLLRAGLFAGATVPMIVPVAAAVRLTEGRVCFRPTDSAVSQPFNGLFVTQTDNRIYVGDSDDVQTRRLHAFPSDVVAQVSVGAIASGSTCQLSAASADVAGKDVRDGSLSGNDVDNGSLDGRDVADGSLTRKDLANGSITGREIRDGTLRASDFAPGVLPSDEPEHDWRRDP
jgi:hypothetical protein